MLLIVTVLSCNSINAYANNYPKEHTPIDNGRISFIASEYSNVTPLLHFHTNDSIQKTSEDSLYTDTSAIDSLKEIIQNPKKAESAFKSKVTYHGDDSIMIDNRNNKAYMWGNAWVKYESIELQADYLEIDFEKNEVFAKGLPDSTGKLINTPVFIEKGQEYKSGEMIYNFRSKKGLIKKITTQEASGYIHGEKVKMASQDVFYIKNGKYTTCELDHPHYYIQSKKLKIINNDKIVTGPAYMAVEDVPTFLAMPFGFFPNQDKRTSGILIPAIGNSQTKGFSLSNGGYYFGFSDTFDMKFLGDIYSNGSWSGKAIANYNTRYKRNGALQVSYTNNKVGERDTPEYAINTAFFVNWRHTQDPKAKPNSNFTAMVNMGSSDYFQNDLNTSSSNFLRNEFTSNITYTQKFRQSPFTASINASHNQNNQDSIINFVLPEVNVTMARIYPLKRKNKIGRDKWYEKVGVTYSGGFKNELSTKITNIFPDGNSNSENPSSGKTPSELIGDFNNGVRHRINTSTSFKLGHLNVSPGVSYNETWYFKSVNQQFDTSINGVAKDTVSGFNRFGNLNLNASLSTKLYGMFAFRGERLKAIRHTMTPSVSFSYQPNLSELHPEYFGETVTDTSGSTRRYTVFDGSVYGTPNGNEMGVVSFQLQNIVEMKHKKRNDTTDKFTNVNLIDAWNFNTSYNMLADSFNWEQLRMDIRSRIGKFVNINVGTTSDFYGTKTETNTESGEETVSRSTNFYFNQTGKPLRLTQLRTSLGLTLSGESFGTTDKQNKEINKINDPQDVNTIYQESQYVNFNVPWDLKVNYVLTYNKPLEEVTVVNSLNFSGSINLTPGWKIQMRSSYDFDLNKLGYTTMNVYRDLHCWQIDLSLTPFGSRKSFMLNIKVKQGFLQDLKLSRNSRWFDS